MQFYRIMVRIASQYRHFSRTFAEYSKKYPYGCGFTRPIRADKSIYAALFNRKTQTIQSLGITEILGEVSNLDNIHSLSPYRNYF